MSGDGKDAGQETADEVHPPCPPVEPETEGSGREDDRGTLAHEIFSPSAAVSGDRKDAGQETADEVHPPIPCPLVEPETEELDREDDRGTELHGHGSPEKVPQACSIKRGKKRGRSPDQSMVESSHNQDRPPMPVETEYSARREVPLTNELFKWRTPNASEEPPVEQEAEAERENTGSGQGSSCWPFHLPLRSKKKDSKK